MGARRARTLAARHRAALRAFRAARPPPTWSTRATSARATTCFHVGRTPWSAAGPPAGFSPVNEERDGGVPRGPGGPPYLA